MITETLRSPTTVDHIRSLVDLLPNDPFGAPPASAIRALLENRELAEPVLIEALEAGVENQMVPMRGYRNVYLMSILGEWRAEACVPTLLRHLLTPWGYGWDEIGHAASRIGGPALTPFLYAAFDRTRSTLARRRAIRALASVGSAAKSFGARPEWIGDGPAQHREVLAAIQLLLRRHETEAPELIDEAAARLCDLQCVEAWPQIEAMFEAKILRERDGFTISVARDLIEGRLHPFELGLWNASMTDWMLRSGR